MKPSLSPSPGEGAPRPRASRSHRLLAAALAASLAGTAHSLPRGESWSYLRPGNTGIQGDYCEALWIGPDGDPLIGGYNPVFEDGGFSKFIQAENRWENFSTVDLPEIGSRHDVGAARVNDITQAPDGKLWMTTWLAVLEFDPAIGASSIRRWDAGNSPHTGGRTLDVEVAPDGSVWVTIMAMGAQTGGLLRYEPVSNTWSSWGSGTTANNWPSGTFSCDDLAVQPKPGGGYTVWIGDAFTGRMINYDSATQSFSALPDTGAPGEVLSIPDHDAVDDAGNLWARRVAPSGGLATVLDYRRPDGTWVSPPQVAVGSDGFKAFGNAQAVAADPSNGVWRFDGGSWSYLGQWKTGSWTYAVDIDSQGNVWASGIGGAARRDAVTGQWQRYRVTNTGMLDYFTRDLVLDDSGGVWMTGNAAPGVGGFQHFDGQRWFNHNDLNYGIGGPWGFPTDNADAIALRDDGTVVVNPMFNGIHEWTGSQYVDMQGMGTSDGLVVDALDRVWSIGNYFSLAYHDGAAWNNVAIDGWGANVQRDPDVPGMVWALANFEVVRTDGSYRFSRETIDFPPFTPTSGTFTTVAAAPGGVAWVGSTKGLFRVDSATGAFDWYHQGNSALPGDQVSPMAVTPDGRVWFTNQGSNWPDQGLGWFDGTSFGYYPQTEVGVGLPHAQIADMEVRVIPGGYELWISCTSEGVAVLTVTGDEPVGTSFCHGDGSGAGCPCGNFGAPGHGCAGSVGTGSTLSATGSASIGGSDLVLRARGSAPSRPGMFFQGSSQLGGGLGLPFGDGLRCVGGAIVRLEVVSADALGQADSSASIAAAGGVLAGQPRYYQWWYRDPMASPCGSGFNLSNALEVQWAP